MKILFVSSVPTDPVDAGNRARVAAMVETLQTVGHEVHLAHIQTGSFDGEAMACRLGAGRLHLMPFLPQPPKLSWVPRLARIVAKRLRLDAGYLWPLDSWYDEAFTPRLHELQRVHRFDVVIVSYVFMSKAFDAFPAPCLRVLDTHDRFGMRHRSFLAAGMRPRWFSTTLENEEAGFRRADVVLAIQEQEAADFRRRLSGSESPRVLTVGHLLALQPLAPLAKRPAAVFLGSDNPINVQGLVHFVDAILPLVRSAEPEFELMVAGSVANQVDDAPGIVKLGFVPDLRDVFSTGMLFVNPVLMGTGINIKLLEAMACGMPCVCTRTGARGLGDDTAGIDVLPDDEPGLFAERVIALLRDPVLRAARRASTRAAAEHWNRLQVDALLELTDDRQSQPG